MRRSPVEIVNTWPPLGEHASTGVRISAPTAAELVASTGQVVEPLVTTPSPDVSLTQHPSHAQAA
jgi:hypothetical protein